MKPAPAKSKSIFSDLARVMQHLPGHNEDPVLLILKGHLLIESLLRDYIDRLVANPGQFDHRRFSYSQILQLCRAFKQNGASSWIFVAAKLLNDARNDCAHTLNEEKFAQATADFSTYVERHIPNAIPPSAQRNDARLYLAIMDLQSEAITFLREDFLTSSR